MALWLQRSAPAAAAHAARWRLPIAVPPACLPGLADPSTAATASRLCPAACRSQPIRAAVPQAELDRVYDIKYYGEWVLGGC